MVVSRLMSFCLGKPSLVSALMLLSQLFEFRYLDDCRSIRLHLSYWYFCRVNPCGQEQLGSAKLWQDPWTAPKLRKFPKRWPTRPGLEFSKPSPPAST